MNSNQINSLLRHIPSFLGVFPADALPSVLPKNFSLIVNTDKSDKPGSHWISIIGRGNTAYYFDSMGGRSKVQEIDQFCRNFAIVFYNKRRHQDWESENCGAFAIYCINEMSKGKSFQTIVQLFETIKEDDEFVKSYLQRNFSFYL